MRFSRCAAALAALAAGPASAIDLDITSPASIKSAASEVAADMVSYYAGNQPGNTPGILGGIYYWWEAGAMFGTLIDYWYYTGDAQYNDITSQALLFQAGPTYDYMPQNQTKDEGNDDQVFWAFSVMTAAEYKFPNPPASYPAWVSLAAAVFNSQAARWDTDYCQGGLRWQIFAWNNGYNYKNSPSNAGFINLGSRLYAYTGNETYAGWVVKTWDWMEKVGLLSNTSAVYDGTDALQNCTQLDHVQWTYSAGMMLNAAAVMYNATGDEIWQTRMMGIWEACNIFFVNDVMTEEACESQNNCDTDQLSFKAYFSRFLAASTKWVPSFYNTVQPYLSKSAVAAAAQCDGGANGMVCGSKWTIGKYDGTYGVGQQMSALEVIQANLINTVGGPVTEKKGGISKGNATLGTGGDQTSPVTFAPVTTSDRAGAGILSALVIAGTLGGAYWIVS